MSSDYIHDQRDNLANYFVLPLIQFNKSSFTTSNFINSYVVVHPDKPYLIAVDVMTMTLVPFSTVKSMYYRSVTEIGGYKRLYFSIPLKWTDDIGLFAEGRYSRLSAEAKDLIRRYSGLRYNVKVSPQSQITDIKLMAMDRSPVLRKKLEESLVCTVPADAELLSKPNPHNFLIG